MPVRLILMRHAKSAWPEGVADFDRPLAPRGQDAAPMMARWLAKAGFAPDLALVSAAKRTRETWALAALHFPATEVEATPAIYAASVGALRELVQENGGNAATLMIVGHNPGMHELAFGLSNPKTSEREAFQRLSQKYPTAGIAILESEGDWRDITPQAMRLTMFITPRMLGGVDED